MTGFRSLSELYEECNQYERKLLLESFEAYADERDEQMPSLDAGAMGL